MRILEARGVTKYFGGVAAIADLDFSIEHGEILGLIGPNGAGKTTLAHLISGLMPLSRGLITFQDKSLNGLGPDARAKLGIARTFQVMRPLAGMTVQENVVTAALFGRLGSTRNVRAAFDRSDGVLELVGLAHVAGSQAAKISIGETKRLELARALAMDPTLLILDEVLAGLTPGQMDNMLELLRQVNAGGITLVVIEHVMRAIRKLCNRVIVLHNGKKIADGPFSEIMEDDRVIEAYLGRKYAAARKRSLS